MIGFELSDLSEEYVVFQINDARADWLETHADWIAGLVRLEPEPAEPQRGRRGDPAQPLVHRRGPGHARLGRRVHRRPRLRRHAPGDRVRQRPAPGVPPYRRPPRRPPRSRLSPDPPRAASAAPRRRPWRPRTATPCGNVRELEIEATSLFERADNALKLIGDQYLSRVFDLASTRFHLRDWQQSIRRKLDTVGDVYDLLVQQAGGQRMEALEIIVVVLIALEIVLAVVRH